MIPRVWGLLHHHFNRPVLSTLQGHLSLQKVIGNQCLFLSSFIPYGKHACNSKVCVRYKVLLQCPKEPYRFSRSMSDSSEKGSSNGDEKIPPGKVARAPSGKKTTVLLGKETTLSPGNDAPSTPGKETMTSPGTEAPVKKPRTLVLSFELPTSNPVPVQLHAAMQRDNIVFHVTDKETGEPVDVIDEPYLHKKPTTFKVPTSEKAKGGDKYIDGRRAMHNYLLTPKDLTGLLTLKKRSPYSGSISMNLYRTNDIKSRAIEVWGSLENLNREKKRRQSYYLYSPHGIRSPEATSDAVKEKENFLKFISKGSGRVISAAIVVNSIVTLLKWFHWYGSGSKSIFAEAVHTTFDTLNQLLLLYGSWKSLQQPDDIHPYGYSSMKNIVSLASGLCFMIGGFINIYHGVENIIFASSFDTEFTSNMIGLLVSCSVLEIAPFIIALMEATKTITGKENLSIANLKKTWEKLPEYVTSATDPGVAIVLMEDAVAVFGNVIAALTIGLSTHLSVPWIDSLGSILIGCMLGSAAVVIFRSNTDILIGRSISETQKSSLVSILESDPAVRSVHDVKAISYGNMGGIRLKAEIDYDGVVIAEELLIDLDPEQLSKEMDRIYGSPEEQKQFLLKFGSQVVDKLGIVTDRVEATVKGKHKNIRHIDLESL